MRDVHLGIANGARVLGLRLPLGLAVVGASLCGATAALEGQANPVRGSYGALLGAAFGIAIPVYCYSVSGRLGTPECAQLRESWTRFGADRRAIALGELAVAACWAVGFSLLVAVGSVVLSGAPSSLGMGADAATTAWIAALAALVYVPLLVAAGTWWRGGGALVALVADWMLGSGAQFGALAFPRAHLRSLLGGEPVFGLSQAASSVVLGMLAAVLLGVFALRTPR